MVHIGSLLRAEGALVNNSASQLAPGRAVLRSQTPSLPRDTQGGFHKRPENRLGQLECARCWRFCYGGSSPPPDLGLCQLRLTSPQHFRLRELDAQGWNFSEFPHLAVHLHSFLSPPAVCPPYSSPVASSPMEACCQR